MTTFLDYLLETRTSKQKNFNLNKQFILDELGHTPTNMTVAIASRLKIFKNTLLSNGIEVDNIDDLSLYDLKKLLDDNGIEIKKHLHLDKSNTNFTKDAKFIKTSDFGKQQLEKGKSIAQTIKYTREKLIKAIDASDKKLVDIEKKSLEELNDFIKNNEISIKARAAKWRLHEKDIAKGISNLFKIEFFKIKKGKKTQEVKDIKLYNAEVVGGSNQSDVKVSHNDKSFFVECKLNLQTSEYFKFGLTIDGDSIKYNHQDFIDGDKSDEQIQTINDIFKKIDLSKFLTDLTKDKDIKAYWKQFKANVNDIVKFIRNNEEFKQFAIKGNIQDSYPKAFKQLAQVFDLYCQHYITKYNTLIDKLFELLTYDEITKRKNDFKIRKHSKDALQSEAFKKLSVLQANIQTAEKLLNDKIITDKKKFQLLVTEIKKIEVKLTILLNDLERDPNDFNGLNDIPKKEQLKYFFKLFISSTGRKLKGKNALVLPDADEAGNMQLLPNIELENSRLGQMITDFYVLKDSCAYVQIADRIFIFDTDFNPLNIPNLPIFKDALSKFSVKLLVDDELTKISLHIQALEPDKQKIHKFNHLSFIQKDTNYIGKALKNGITISIKS